MKQPNECQNIHEIRAAIDEIDQKIISLIANRAEYVQAVVKFKSDASSVKAPDRVKAMLQKRGEWAETKNLNPKVIQKLFSDLVAYFINEEMAQFQQEDSYSK